MCYQISSLSDVITNIQNDVELVPIIYFKKNHIAVHNAAHFFIQSARKAYEVREVQGLLTTDRQRYFKKEGLPTLKRP